MTDYRVYRGEAKEDQVTAAIEKVTSQVPSSAYLDNDLWGGVTDDGSGDAVGQKERTGSVFNVHSSFDR